MNSPSLASAAPARGTVPDTAARDRAIRRNVLGGMLVNAALTAMKLVAGLLVSSRALVVDAVHSLTDFGTDGLILFGAHVWSRPPDEDHPYGHRRIETAITLAVGLILCAAGLAMGYKAVRALVSPDAGAPVPGWPAFYTACASIVAKEALYRWTTRVGRCTHSAALQANAWHHRSDALSSIPVALAIGASRQWPNLAFLDNAGAVVVAVLLAQAALKIIRPAVAELMELGAPAGFTQDIEATALSVEGVKSVHAIRSRYAASQLFIDLHVQVDPAMSIAEAHDISSRVCSAIHAREPAVLDVLVHLEPYRGEDGTRRQSIAPRTTDSP